MPTQMTVEMTAARMNYWVSKKLIFKWQGRLQEDSESLNDDSRNGRDNVRWHNLAESLMDAHINRGAVQHQGAQMTLYVFNQLLLTSV